LLQKKGNADEETLLKTGKQVEVQGNWANLTLDVSGMQDTVQSVHFEVARKSFSLIVPAKPIQTLEKHQKDSSGISSNRCNSQQPRFFKKSSPET
jgi:hypothetical protein